MKSGINPFDSQEAKPYKNDPEILAMTNLVSSYQNNDINEFETILKQNRRNIMDDPFIREHIEGELKQYYVLIDWLVGMLLVSTSGLEEEDAVELFHHYGIHLSSSFLM